VTEVYWIGKRVVIEWALTDLAGAAVTDATVTGEIRLPDGSTAAADIDHPTGTGTYRASYEATVPGRHAWRLEASGSVETAEEGVFDVQPSPAAGPAPTLDPATDIGQVRVLIPDRDPAVLLFSDDEITVFLGLARGTGGPRIKRAAASALEAIASNEAMISKVIRTQDLSTDGAKVSDALLKRAAALRDQAADDEDTTADDGGLGIVDFRDPWTRRADGELAEWEVC
jgi:hypothetical protein